MYVLFGAPAALRGGREGSGPLSSCRCTEDIFNAPQDPFTAPEHPPGNAFSVLGSGEYFLTPFFSVRAPGPGMLPGDP